MIKQNGARYQIIRALATDGMLPASELAEKTSLTAGQVIEIQVIENLQRDDVNELEEAAGYETMMRECGYSADELAALEGWIALWQRISEHKQLELDLQPMRLLAARLHHGTPITPDEVARCVEIVTATKRHYRRMDVFDIGKLVKTQLIANKLEEMGVTTT